MTDARTYAEVVEPTLRPVAATLLALAGIREGEVVVDAGCGTGFLTYAAAAAAGQAGRVFGVDADAGALSFARSRRASGIGWVRAEAGRLPFASATVDKVLRGPGPTPAGPGEWRRVLRPGGRAVAGAWVPGPPSAADKAVAKALVAYGVEDPAQDLVADLAGAGLRVTYDGADDLTVPFAGPEEYVRWCLAFLTLPADVTAEVVAALGPGPVVANATLRYAVAVA